jgi:multiple sugar transport system permease protein
MIVLVIPTQAMVIPNYIFYLKLGLNHTPWPLILPELLGNGLYGALFVFVFKQVFSGIPKDLEDAAAIDGAGFIKTFRSIVAPLAQNAYITVGLFSFVLHWNEYTRPLYYLSDQTKTLSLALSFLFVVNPTNGLPMANEAVQGAGIILMMAPVIIIYILVQKYFVQGVQLTGIKG